MSVRCDTVPVRSTVTPFVHGEFFLLLFLRSRFEGSRFHRENVTETALLDESSVCIGVADLQNAPSGSVTLNRFCFSE